MCPYEDDEECEDDRNVRAGLVIVLTALAASCCIDMGDGVFNAGEGSGTRSFGRKSISFLLQDTPHLALYDIARSARTSALLLYR
jgi:hypothetical protein